MSIERFIFNLDLPENERWIPILKAYEKSMPKLKNFIDKTFESMGLNGIAFYGIKSAIWLLRNKMMYSKELISISEFTGINLEKIVVMQLMYEMCAACTTFVTNVNVNVKDSEKTTSMNVMFRTMDWEMDFLKELTVELDVRRDGKTLFIAPTWVGCVGMFTTYTPIQYAPNNYSIAVNYRRTNNFSTSGIIANIWKVLTFVWPIGYLVRFINEKRMSYADAFGILSDTQLVTPCYITLYNPSDVSYILTRNPNYLVNVRSTEKFSHLVQTNMDYSCYNRKKQKKDLDMKFKPNATINSDENEDNILWSQERYDMIEEHIDNYGNKFKSFNELKRLVEQNPIKNHETIYMCIMTPKFIVTEENTDELFSKTNLLIKSDVNEIAIR